MDCRDRLHDIVRTFAEGDQIAALVEFLILALFAIFVILRNCGFQVFRVDAEMRCRFFNRVGFHQHAAFNQIIIFVLMLLADAGSDHRSFIPEQIREAVGGFRDRFGDDVAAFQFLNEPLAFQVD